MASRVALIFCFALSFVSYGIADEPTQALSEKPPSTATGYDSLAAKLHSQGKYAEAEPLCRKALKLRLETLGEKNPDTAAGYNNLAYNLNAQGKYAEAQPLFQKALDLRLELVGEKNQATAISYNNLAYNLNAQGKYAEAQPLYRKALELHADLFGENHPTTATIYSNVALNLDAQKKHVEAQQLHQKALELRLKLLGEKHRDTATSYSNLAGNLDSLGKFDEAEPLYQKALQLRLELLGEKHPDTAGSYNNLAYTLDVRGKYAEAQPLFEKALGLSLELLGKKHPRVALSYINLAGNLERQGKYADAQPLYQKALDLSRQALGEKHPQIAMCYRCLAANLSAQEKFAEAEGLYLQAVELLGKEHPDTAEIERRRASISLFTAGQWVDAEPFLRKALKERIGLLGEKHPRTAAAYSELAGNLNSRKKYADAQPFYEKALELHRELFGENHPHTALGYANLATNLQAQNKHAEAERALVQAAASYEAARLSVAERGLDRAVFGAERSPYRLLAAVRARLGEREAAWLAAETDLARGLNDETAARHGAALSPGHRDRHAALANRLSQIAPLVVQLASQRSPTDEEKAELKKLQRERRALEAQTAELAVAVSKQELAPLADIQAALADDAALIMWIEIPVYDQKRQEHWGCVVRRSGEPIWEELPAADWVCVGGTGQDEAMVRWRFGRGLALGAAAEDLTEVAHKLYARRIAPLKKHLEGIKRLVLVPGREMAGVPVDVLTDNYVVSYVPSGTLLARLKLRPPAKGVSLLALGDPWPLPKEPAGEPPPRGILIWQIWPDGNAAKAGLRPGDRLLKYAGKEVLSVQQLAKLAQEWGPGKAVQVTIARMGQVTDVELQRTNLGIGFNFADQSPGSAMPEGGWTELPATAVEVRRLGMLVDSKGSVVFTRSAASERELERLRTSGRLAQFRYLHFATHGEPNGVRSFDSALILAQDRVDGGVPLGGAKPYDGRLTAREVLENWQLNADLVTLSACESALGPRGGGDGFLGFEQAFLLAGARSVCLSLWKVDDTATALLMDRFYQNLLGKRAGLSQPMPKAEALAEAKRWLRSLTLDEARKLAAAMTSGVARGKSEPALKLAVPAASNEETAKDDCPFAHPRYWAAFILIGDPD